MFAELRIYELEPGGEAQIVRRLTQFMPPLFARHGLRPVAQWLSQDEATFVWMLRWPDLTTRMTAFADLYADPGFAAAVAATQPDGPWLARFHTLFLTPSVAHPAPSFASGEVDELHLAEIRPGTAGRLAIAKRNTYAEHSAAPQGTLMGHFDVVSGWPLQCFAEITRWPTANVSNRAPDAEVMRSTRWLLRPLDHCRARPGLG